MIRLICLLIGYVFGLFPTGKLIAKMRGVDLSKVGSGNTGATNSVRAMGAKYGLLVLLGDCMKCVLACILVRVLFGQNPDTKLLYVVYAGFGAILGHDYPVYNKFKGGKGISSTLGLLLAIADWRLFLPCMLVFLAIVFTTRYVSLGSILASVVMAFVWTGLNAYEMVPIAQEYRMETVLILFIVMTINVVRHKANILRLMTGTESKFSFKKSA